MTWCDNEAGHNRVRSDFHLAAASPTVTIVPYVQTSQESGKDANGNSSTWTRVMKGIHHSGCMNHNSKGEIKLH